MRAYLTTKQALLIGTHRGSSSSGDPRRGRCCGTAALDARLGVQGLLASGPELKWTFAVL